MLSWNYFKTISILYGLAMVFKGPVIHLFPERWQEFEPMKIYEEGLPRWLWLPVSFGFFLVIYTWYRHFTTDIEHSWVISIALTAIILKLTQFLLSCGSPQKLSDSDSVECLWRIAITNIIITLGGALLLYLGFFVY